MDLQAAVRPLYASCMMLISRLINSSFSSCNNSLEHFVARERNWRKCTKLQNALRPILESKFVYDLKRYFVTHTFNTEIDEIVGDVQTHKQ